MGEEHVIYDAARKRRVIIRGSSGGTYTFVEEYFSDEPLEMSWIPLTYRRSIPICESFEIAMREARGRVEWLAAVDEG
jgi:hypothetical protein